MKGIDLFAYIARRLSAIMIILLGSSFFVYNLEAYAGDPLEELRLSNDPRKEQMILNLTNSLDLNTPPPLRYFKWLGGLLGVFTGNLDLGPTRTGESVVDQIATAIPTTLRLVVAATFIAIFLGISIGMITALRQYSRFDYSVTFASFLFFSLPIFWVAVLLKQFLAIGFNDWLANPQLTWQWVLGLSLASAIFWAGVLASSRKKTLIVFLVALASSAAVITVLGLLDWFNYPGLGPIMIVALGAGVAVGVTILSTGLNNKRSLFAALGMAALGGIVYYPVQLLFTKDFSFGLLLLLAVATILVGAGVGWLAAKYDKGAVMRTTAITAFIVATLIFIDRLMQNWQTYVSNDYVSFRPIPTVGQSNTLLQSDLDVSPDFWMSTLDGLLHLVLPTIALCIISFATYVRYTRGSLLEVLNQDYIRTARAKGLSERTVIMRHAFRNALIPLTTLVAWDIAGMIGGAIITERVFGWIGMGTLFNKAIVSFDLNLLMGVALITSFMAVMANLFADLVYSALDPRIRVK